MKPHTFDASPTWIRSEFRALNRRISELASARLPAGALDEQLVNDYEERIADLEQRVAALEGP